MSLEVVVLCDGCGAVMAGGKTGKQARDDARDSGFDARTFGSRDYCGSCRALDRHEPKIGVGHD